MAMRKTSATHPLRVDFIEGADLGFPGRIGLTFAPGKKQTNATGKWDRDLEADLHALREKFKTDLLVSLIEEHEFAALRIPSLREEVRRYGIEMLWFPIRDASVPSSIERFYQAVQHIVATLRKGKTTVIHCKGGLGRTGLVAAAVLMAIAELTPEEATRIVRRARPGAIETPDQEEYVRVFHRHIWAL